MKMIRLTYRARSGSYWIQDGLSFHWTPAIREYAVASNIGLTPTPTYASILNRMEATFGAIDEFVCKNAGNLDWDAFGHALAEPSATATTPPSEKGATATLPNGGHVEPSRPRQSSSSPPEHEDVSVQCYERPH